MKEGKRQRQIASLIKMNFSIVLQQEGTYIYDTAALVTITEVKVTSDLGIARIYLSVYNVVEKESVINSLQAETARLKYLLGQRLKRQLRRLPNIELYLDNTLDEMERINSLFDRLDDNKQTEETDDDQ